MFMNSNTNNSIPDDDIEGVHLEASIADSRCDESIYPVAEVRIEKAQFSILHLYNLYTRRDELVIDPEYQRFHVWKDTQSSELIESILMGIPIPIMYLFEDRYGKKQVVDGRQRITSVLSFLNNELKLKGLKILKQFNNCKFSDLELKVQGTFEDYQLFFYIIQPPTPESIKYDIFDRVNRGGTQLNKQEMRNALYNGKATKLIKQISESEEFTNATGKGLSPQRMKDQYVVLRTLAFLLLKKSKLNTPDFIYRSDIDDFLAKFMIYLNKEVDDYTIDKYKYLYLSSLRKCYTILGENAFRFDSKNRMRPINMLLAEILIYLFSHDLHSIDERILKSSIINLKIELDESGSITSNIDSSNNVDLRFKLIDNLLEELLK